MARHGSGRRFTDEAITYLLEYDWPGNVRELENCIQSAIALSASARMDVRDLPAQVVANVERERQVRKFARPLPRTIEQSAIRTPVLPLNEVEKRAILDALEYTKGDRTYAAHMLGISRTTLYRKLKEYLLAV
jgi:DNA-binding NtrC family response regulator